MISPIQNLIIFFSSQDFWIIFFQSFIVSFIFCIPFTFFIFDKYIENKPMSHKEAWSPYIIILSYCILLNMIRVYSYSCCEPTCLYVLGNLEFASCCKHKLK